MVDQAPEQPDSLTEDDYIELLERAAEKIQRLERQVKTYQTMVVLEGRSKKAKGQLGGKQSEKTINWLMPSLIGFTKKN